MKKRVYIETAGAIYFPDRPGRDTLVATRDLWPGLTAKHATYIPAIVYEEAG